MLAVDLHDVRDPWFLDSRLNLGAVFVLRIPYEDVKTSKTMNSAQTMTNEELQEAKAKNPNFVPKSIWRESRLSSEVSEQQVFSFLRGWQLGCHYFYFYINSWEDHELTIQLTT